MLPAADGGLQTGTILVGKYRIDSVLGSGGMGMVYRALHLALNEDVAIKMLRRDSVNNEEAVARFMREAQSAAKLKSEHVARVTDVNAESGSPFMVMEYLQGADLGALVEQNGPMWPGIAVDLLMQACDAISEAHSLGIVHRDIKPNNLFVSFRPDQTAIVKVLDFGISKSSNQVDMSLTQTQSVLGSPAYMSPEQMRSARSVDQRSDIWSIGTVLYEIVEGRRPFQADSFSEMCVMVAADPPAPMNHAPELFTVIGRCLAKRPEDRYANVAELMRDLLPFAHNPDAARFYITRAQRVLGLSRTTDNTPVPRPLSSYGSAPIIQTAIPLHMLTMHGHRTQEGPAAVFANPMTTVNAPRVETIVTTKQRSRRGIIIGGGLALGAVAAIVVALLANNADHTPTANPTKPTLDVATPMHEIAHDPVAPTLEVVAPATPPDAAVEEVATTPPETPAVTQKPTRVRLTTKPTTKPAIAKVLTTEPPQTTRTVAKPPADPFSTRNPGSRPTAPPCDPFASRTGCK
ncbi:MAG TPA: protein kinase [Kofleriaceae bacterium]|jgi:serine/threonine-protein kinase